MAKPDDPVQAILDKALKDAHLAIPDYEPFPHEEAMVKAIADLRSRGGDYDVEAEWMYIRGVIDARNHYMAYTEGLINWYMATLADIEGIGNE